MTAPTIPPATADPQEVDAIIAAIGRLVPAGYLTSLVRTVVPAAIAAGIGYAGLHWHVLVGVHPSPGVVEAVDFGIFTVLYAGARWLENRRGNGILAKTARGLARLLLSLGVPTTAPKYPTTP